MFDHAQTQNINLFELLEHKKINNYDVKLFMVTTTAPQIEYHAMLMDNASADSTVTVRTVNKLTHAQAQFANLCAYAQEIMRQPQAH